MLLSRPTSHVTRRQFLKQSSLWTTATLAAIGGGLTTGCGSSAAVQKIIDVHIHANFHDDVLRRQAMTLSRVDLSPAGLMAEMAASNVVQAIKIGFESDGDELSRDADNPMGLSTNDGPTAVKNLSLIGGINPYKLDDVNLARVEDALNTKQLIGLKIYLGYYPIAADDDRYKRVYELAGKYSVPVMLHTGDTYSANAKVRFAHPLIIDDLAVDFREVKFILAHLGNPWTIDAAELLYKNENVYADLSGFLVGDESYFADPKNAEGIDHAIDRIRQAIAWVENPRKFMYGSDWPLVPMKPYIDVIRRAIDPEHRALVFYENARAVFSLPAQDGVTA